MSRVTLIAAATTNNGIGHAGTMPWRLPREMQYFAKVTSGKETAQDVGGEKHRKNAVVMGRATWESIPRRFRPLAGRINIVVSRQAEYDLGVTRMGTDENKKQGEDGSDTVVLAPSLEAALQRARTADAHRLFVIGGAKLYAAALPFAERVLLTRIVEPAFEECDVFMPDFIGGEGGQEWTRAGHDALSAWVGFDVPKGQQSEGGVEYEFEMWTRE
ncbi:dihydrofolate reductase-like domain-containing protein [Lactarius psammicola]|nr:dihydrofolate reductase-like domain-containing protein [Lactarius psammicola]